MNNNLNLISLDLPAADLQAIRAAVQVLQDKLVPHLVTLEPGMRRELPRMGDKTVAFVRKAADYAHADARLVPAYLDLDEMARDLRAVEDLLSLQRPLAQIAAGLDDAILAAGSEAYGAALGYYQAVKGAARAGVTGAEAIAADLGQRFPGRPRARGGEAQP
jgi:hypothetical protein